MEGTEVRTSDVMPVIEHDPRDNIVTGALWRSKRKGERHRTVLITGLHATTPRTVSVERNTSRRTQGMREDTLLKDYEFVRHAR